uniref:Uncharacterized protein n=1 Tax=Aegilops tauschii subsp. strangulata TaxID=200361 RepID=A0A452YHE0_AEGTS
MLSIYLTRSLLDQKLDVTILFLSHGDIRFIVVQWRLYDSCRIRRNIVDWTEIDSYKQCHADSDVHCVVRLSAKLQLQAIQ